MTDVRSDGHDEQSLSDRYHGQTPPGHGSEWKVATISKRVVTNGGKVDTTVRCEQTGEDVRLGDMHFYLTAKKDRDWHSPAFIHFVVRDEAALEAWFDE